MTMAKAPKNPAAAPREVGPTRVFILLNEGADVAGIRAAISGITTDKSAVLDFDAGAVRKFIPLILERGARKGKAPAASAE